MNVQGPILASRVVTEEMHGRFAALSGDCNPMHVDSIAARRTQAGRRVVHGIHSLLWALESLIASGHKVVIPIRIKARFLEWVYPGDECLVRAVSNGSSGSIQLKVEVGEVPVLIVEVAGEVGHAVSPGMYAGLSPIIPTAEPLNPGLNEIAERSGDAYTAAPADVSDVFPHLVGAWGAARVAEVIACSYVVGMQVPGLHSMFSRLDLMFLPASADLPRAALRYQVHGWDERFRKVRIAVEGCGVSGMLEAFVRVPPSAQASMEMVAAQVDRSEFVGMNALIIGGSRGLGEVVAKLIAAGGGTSTISYALGKCEAERLAGQICAWGGKASTLSYNVLLDAAGQVEALPEAPTHLFYFATNRISRAKTGVFCSSMFAEFLRFYVHGFYDLCVSLIKFDEKTSCQKDGAASRQLTIFYPSTVMVEERPPGMAEYAMAKAAGEQLCKDMNQYLPEVQVIVNRLPKLPTDQTAGVLTDVEIDPVATLLPVVREMQSKSRR
jgi:acyl dehydratase/NAD(P)-dependent dehydrogenase (short-subunit alcohol dehydrogenase family)